MSGNSQGDNRRPLDPKRGRAEPARADYLWADGTDRLLETREHASQDDPEVDAFIQHAPAKKLDGRMTVDELTALTIETGKFSVAGIGTVEDDLRLFFRD